MPATPTFTQRDRARISAILRAKSIIDTVAAERPVYGIHTFPHENGQRQALESDAIVRVLIPGNGWGKTTLMVADADFLLQRDDPYKPHVVPDRPTTVLWFCQKYGQFEIMQPKIEALLTRGFTWKRDRHLYTWPNGSRMFVCSSDSDWASIQGIEVDAVYFDEHPDRRFWVEMMFRRRGTAKARYMVAATMTQGVTWFVQDVVMAAERAGREAGLTAEQRREIQPHPRVWLWDAGGIDANPVMTDEDRDNYCQVEGISEKERTVRLSGGYADFTGEAVFDRDALDAMPVEPGRTGILEWLPDVDEDAARVVQIKRARDLRFQHRFSGRLHPDLIRFTEGPAWERGRVTIFEDPDPDWYGSYVIGFDAAAGLAGMDFDAACVVRPTEDGPAVQVAELHGRWGDVFLAEALYLLGVWYGVAFIVGERQFGLPVMRRMFDEMGYPWFYHQREQRKKGQRASDLLGHHRHAGDTVIPNHRLAIHRQDVILRGEASLTEHKRYQFRPRATTKTMDDVSQSADLVTGAPPGEYDDLVLAAAYANHGLRTVSKYPRPVIDPAPSSAAAMLEMPEEILARTQKRKPRRKAKQQDPYSLRGRR